MAIDEACSIEYGSTDSNPKANELINHSEIQEATGSNQFQEYCTFNQARYPGAC